MSAVGGIQVTCFAVSYAISILAETLRLLWPGRTWRWLAAGFAAAGIAAHSLYLANRAAQTGQLPIATQFESLLTVSWLIGMVYLYLSFRDRRLAAGLFILPVSLGLIVFAAALSDRGIRPVSAENEILSASHGILLLVGTAVALFAFVVAAMYLVKFHQLKVGTIFGRIRLPSLERLDRLNTAAVYIAYPLLTIGMLLGLSMRQLDWTDPKVLLTFFAWGAFTVLVHYRYHPENRGRRMAILTIVACLVVLVGVLADPLTGTGHQAVVEGRR
jgi:ABC-type transport system involved in cytochrome c biogenesis permease subunit